MTKNERIIVCTAWAYLRDKATTPEGKSIMGKLSDIIKTDSARRTRQRELRLKG